MNRKLPDLDTMQLVWDLLLAPNSYRLDTRFVLRDGKKHPFALIVPGGAYRSVCSFIEGTPIARKLNDKGVSAFILYYRVREKAAYPAPQDDLARALREILSHSEKYRVEPEAYSIWGSSAGGHLCASFGTQAMGYAKYGLPKPGALILTYPVISMAPELTHRESHDFLLGPDPGPERERFASIDRQVTGDYPPSYLWCGDADLTVPPENSRRMARALENAGVPYRFDLFPGVGHGVGPGTGTAAQGWVDRALDFWLERR